METTTNSPVIVLNVRLAAEWEALRTTEGWTVTGFAPNGDRLGSMDVGPQACVKGTNPDNRGQAFRILFARINEAGYENSTHNLWLTEGVPVGALFSIGYDEHRDVYSVLDV